MSEISKDLFVQLQEVQKALKAPKNRRNTFGNYNYRNCEDIMEGAKPLLPEGVVILLSDEVIHFPATHAPVLIDVVVKDAKGNVTTKKEITNFDRFYIKATAKFTNSTNSIEVTAFAREEDDKKGMDGAQVSGASSSYARKYALNGLLGIDDTQDADAQDNSERPAGGNTSRKPAPIKPAAVPSQPKGEPITGQQLAEIQLLTKTTLKWPDTKMGEVLQTMFKATKLEQISEKQADHFIKKLEEKIAGNSQPKPETNEVGEALCEVCKDPVTKKMEVSSMKKYNKVLCMTHQLQEKGDDK